MRSELKQVAKVMKIVTRSIYINKYQLPLQKRTGNGMKLKTFIYYYGMKLKFFIYFINKLSEIN